MKELVYHYTEKLKKSYHQVDISHSIQELTKLGTPEAVDSIIEHGLKNTNEYTANYALFALQCINTPQAINAIVQHGLGHPEEHVRLSSRNAIREWDTKAEDALVNIGLKHENPITVKSSLELLENMNNLSNKKALPALMKLSGHEDKDIDKDVKEAIQRIQVAQHAKH